MANILVIEDERDVRNLFRRMLVESGFNVDTAADGVAALRMVERREYDVILLDIIMPKKDGLETMSALKRSHPEIKIIVITGGGLHLDADACMEMADSEQCFMKLKKPVKEKTLVDAVNKALEAQ